MEMQRVYIHVHHSIYVHVCMYVYGRNNCNVYTCVLSAYYVCTYGRSNCNVQYMIVPDVVISIEFIEANSIVLFYLSLRRGYNHFVCAHVCRI